MINTNPRGPESNPPIINLRPRAVLPFFDFILFYWIINPSLTRWSFMAASSIQVCYKVYYLIYFIQTIFFFFYRKFQLMASTPNDSSLSSDQDTNQFLV